MKNLFISLLLSIPSILCAQSATTPQLLQEGTIVKATLQEELSGKTAEVGQIIEFSLSEDILLNDTIAVAQGAKITGVITAAARSKALGKKGELAFSIEYLYLPNGDVIKLRNQVEKNLNGSGAGVAAGAILLTPLALFVRGKNAKYATGDIFTAYVD
jgi:hypothetical protein